MAQEFGIFTDGTGGALGEPWENCIERSLGHGGASRDTQLEEADDDSGYRETTGHSSQPISFWTRLQFNGRSLASESENICNCETHLFSLLSNVIKKWSGKRMSIDTLHINLPCWRKLQKLSRGGNLNCNLCYFTVWGGKVLIALSAYALPEAPPCRRVESAVRFVKVLPDL